MNDSTIMQKIQDLVGYGEAQTWALELAQDVELWLNEEIEWSAVEHRAAVLHGPPGTGKTSFAAKLADALGLELISSSVAEWNSHRNLSGTLTRMREVFAKAMATAPCILLLDEVDGISSRDGLAGENAEYWAQIINLMLILVTEALETPGLVIIGATNYAERIDKGLLRSGRLDRIIRIELPDGRAAAKIMAQYLGAEAVKVDLQKVGRRLKGFSGADIEKMVRSARASARRAGRVVTTEDITRQVPDPLAKLTPADKERVAAYRRGQIIVAQLLGLAHLGREDQLGSCWQFSKLAFKGDQFPTERMCVDVLTVIMSGRAAEEIIYGDVSTFGSGNPHSDLVAATALATAMELEAGFGELGPVYLGTVTGRPLSPMVDASIRRRVDRALARASSLLLDHVDEIERAMANSSKAESRDQPHLRLVSSEHSV